MSHLTSTLINPTARGQPAVESDRKSGHTINREGNRRAATELITAYLSPFPIKTTAELPSHNRKVPSCFRADRLRVPLPLRSTEERHSWRAERYSDNCCTPSRESDNHPFRPTVGDGAFCFMSTNVRGFCSSHFC